MENLVLGLCVFMLFQLASCYYSSSNSNEERIDDLERKVERLTQRVDVLTNEFKDSSEEPKRCVEYGDIPENPPGDFPNVLPLEARRELTADGELRISLEYWAQPSTVVTTQWRDETYTKLEPAISNILQPLPVGVSQTQIVIPVGNTSEVMLQISSISNELELRFNTSASTLISQTCIPLPIFRKEPVGDIVYVPGHDTTVRLEVPPKYTRDEDSTPDDYYPNVQADPFFVDLRTGELRGSMESEDFLIDEGTENLLTLQKVTARLNTSEFEVSGFVIFRVNDGTRRGDLVTKIMRSIIVVVRPDNQTGPFPDGYLSFVKYPFNYQSPNGTEIRSCDNNNAFPVGCYIGCTVMGTDITDLRMYKVLDSGERSLMTGYETETMDYDDVKSAWFQSEGGPDGSVVHYQCEATNDHGVFQQHDINVFYYTRALIDPNASGFTKINESVVELRCEVNGWPVSNVTFDLNYGHEEEPDTVQHTHGHVVARKLVLLPPDRDSYGSWFYGHSCKAVQILPTGERYDDYYQFSISLTENGGDDNSSGNETLPYIWEY